MALSMRTRYRQLRQRRPLMTLKVLVHRACTRQNIEPPETLVGAIVMQGIGRFQGLHRNPRCSDLVTTTARSIERAAESHHPSRRASNFALRFALHRQDEDVMVVQEAALLHDFAEMLLQSAPKLALLKAARRQRPTSTSVRPTFKSTRH